jgi:hypothetical protein
VLRAGSRSLPVLGAAVVAAALISVPVAAHDPFSGDRPPAAAGAGPVPTPPPPAAAWAGPVPAPPPPSAAPGETRIPPACTSREDELPLGSARREAALAHLRGVADCARALGADVPEPVSDAEGVHLSWDGPERPAWEAALARCDHLAVPSAGDDDLPPR